MKINSYRLVPGKVAYWGDIVGNISEQKDLVEYISSHGGGDAVWGSITGNISEQSDLMNLVSSFATESWVQSQGYLTSVPSGYATQSWVESQGYITEIPSGYATESWVTSNFLSTTALSGYATESWVEAQKYVHNSDLDEYATKYWVSSQGYLTSSSLEDYATYSWVNNQGFTTQSWVVDQSYISEGYSEVAPLFSLSEGYLRYHTDYVSNIVEFNTSGTQFFDQYGQCYVWTIGNEVYGINFLTPEYDEQNNPHTYIYHYNKSTNGFEHIEDSGHWVEVWGSAITIPMISDVTEDHFLWEDNSGRCYYTNKYQVNLQTGEFTEVVPGGTMGGTLQTYNGSKHNIVRIGNDIYMLYAASNVTQARAYKFNETTQLFEAYGSGTSFSGYVITNWYRYGFYYEGTYYYTRSNTGNYLYKFTVSTTKVYAANSTKPFPTTFSYEGQNFIVTGDRIRRIYVDTGESEPEPVYIYYYGDNAFKLEYNIDLGSYYWNYLDIYRDPRFVYNTNGAECDDFLVGFGYDRDTGTTGAIPVWRFNGSYFVEIYGWDNSIETRLTDIETNLGTALNISNEILS